MQKSLLISLIIAAAACYYLLIAWRPAWLGYSSAGWPWSLLIALAMIWGGALLTAIAILTKERPCKP